MVDIPILAMVIASAVSLIVVGPRRARQEALRTLREYDDEEFVPASVATAAKEQIARDRPPGTKAC
jgi:hypothetical protein